MLQYEESGPSEIKPALEIKHSEYLQATTSENTRTTYESALRQFYKWGGSLPTDPKTITKYLLDNAERLNPNTLDIHLSALGYFHNNNHPSLANPARNAEVRMIMDGIRRVHGRPKRKAKALMLEDIAKLLKWQEKQPEGLKRRRDSALLLIGFFGAFRRSELVTISVEDISWEPEGILIRLPRSKTDQKGEGIYRAIARGTGNTCPINALRIWLSMSGITTGPVFRSINRWGHVGETPLRPSTVNDLLKKWGNACRFTFTPQLSSHSLRRGLSTSASKRNLNFVQIKKQGGWRSDATVHEYIEEGTHFVDNVSAVLTKDLYRIIHRGKAPEKTSERDRVDELRRKLRASERSRKRHAAALRQEREINKALTQKVVELETQLNRLNVYLASQENQIHEILDRTDFAAKEGEGSIPHSNAIHAMVSTRLDEIEAFFSEQMTRLISKIELSTANPTNSTVIFPNKGHTSLS